ncbi:Rne/Rng family ribonuclease [Alphaproteobacteria bacterium]|nr:Rne/Rng family ribonuclease [Alphaproteobacteria bacterium]
MTKRLLIDGRQAEETRVVLLSGTRIEDFDYETENRKQLKGNVYLARVTRVEPSLQAAFVEYGGNRQGFLAFSEIHPDYYRIPIEDRDALMAAEREQADDEDDGDKNGDAPETVGGEDTDEEDTRRKRSYRRYKIQEVVSRKQIMLVQVVKEERGNKGAALTTYLSLAGRYCVLMPNSTRKGGVSRKITNIADRKRLKSVVGALDVPDGVAVIVRTAGAKRTKTEISRDYAYLSKLWDEIRTKTLESQAPSLIHEEGDLIKRSIRDLYTSEVDEVLVEGEEAYKVARAQMKMLIPSHLKRVQKYEDTLPIFQRYQAEQQMDTIHSPQVTLKSGGYLVINQTEALVAVDVNSGRSTRERNIEETALKTNLEAADELARQLRLRDLSGLIVVDFIDMEENKNQNAVERRMKDAMRIDRARIQIGSISHFGLMEMSRQRLRISFNESISNMCPHCEGTGRVRSVETAALQLLRVIEDEALKGKMDELRVTMHGDVALYILNHKRPSINALEEQFGIKIIILSDNSLTATDHNVERLGWQGNTPRKTNETAPAVKEQETDTNSDTEEDADPETPGAGEQEEASDEDQPKRRKRGRRGGRRRRRRNGEGGENSTENGAANGSEISQNDNEADQAIPSVSAEGGPSSAVEDGASGEDSGENKPSKSRSRRRSRGRGRSNGDAGRSNGDAVAVAAVNENGMDAAPTNAEPVDANAVSGGDAEADKPKPRTRKKAAKKAAPALSDADTTSDASADAIADAKTDAIADEEPARQTRKKAAAKTGTTAKKKAAKKSAKKASSKATAKPKPKSSSAKSDASNGTSDQAERAPVISAPQDIVEVGSKDKATPRKGWWSRS